jgi:hypothetical protein
MPEQIAGERNMQTRESAVQINSLSAFAVYSQSKGALAARQRCCCTRPGQRS